MSRVISACCFVAETVSWRVPGLCSLPLEFQDLFDLQMYVNGQDLHFTL